MKTINRLTVIALILLIVAGFLLAAGSVDAGGGGGYCRPLFWILGGSCDYKIKCDIGRPIVDEEPDEDGYYHGSCYYPPTAPVDDGGPLVIDLGVGELAHVLCETRLHFDLFNGEQGLEVLCEE